VQPTINCLTYIRSRLDTEPKNSIQWYKVKSYQFDYFYDYALFDELITVLEPYANDTNLPDEFKAQVYFYYAKALHYTGNETTAKKYAANAFDDLKLIYESFKNPLRIIELANLQYTFGSKDTALQMLLSAQRRFSNSKDPLFHFELHSNKANVYHALGDLESALKSREVALHIISETKQTGKIIVALNNVARTYQLSKKYDLAIKYYENSLSYMKADNIKMAVVKLRLAEINLQKEDNAKAKQWLSEVNPINFNQNHIRLYESLQNELQ
jgi:tetratricopeptide (TPR) repeat protein